VKKRTAKAATLTTKAKRKKTARPAARASTRPAEIKIKPAKGRPMLVWVGKRPLQQVIAYPAQHIETFAPPAGQTLPVTDWSDWPGAYPRGGLLFHGENKEVLAHLLGNGFRGRINLIYIDPPFDSGADYVRKVTIRGPKGTAKLDGEAYTLGEQIQYTDIWANDNYLQFIYERLLLLRELLADSGSIFVHCDWNVSHRLRMLLDEVFLADNFVNEIVWQHAVIGAGRGIYRRLPKAHETIYWYAKTQGYLLETEPKDVRVPYKERITENLTQDEKGWYYTRGRTGTDNPWSRDPRYLRTYVNIEKGRLVHDVWDDLLTYRAQGDEYVGYPTQKPEQMVSRLIALASQPGDLVLDCFLGSGTAAVAAQSLGRRWIGADINKGAIQTAAKRLQGTIAAQMAAGMTLPGLESDQPLPCQLGFTVWRVNDYDLQIQHTESVNLASELLGVQRTRTDSYFDGTLGDSLVKIAPFAHPLTPLELEDLKRELEARPEEDRPITVVCLGIELAAQAWIEEWNALRRGAASVNRIKVIELRTDPKYGKFLKHEPARARVKVQRHKDKIRVEIQDFISPSIIERLNDQAGVLSPQIDNWRAMVDSVMIDTAYDGKVFNVALSDVPERKVDFVQGSYELPAPAARNCTIAVKIIDMLGEEVVVTMKC
jgi:DNA modification methylase